MMNVGDIVTFGREHGAKTVGKIVKINGKTVKVEQTEAGGAHPVGTIWNVSKSLVTLADGSPGALSERALSMTKTNSDAEWRVYAKGLGLDESWLGKTFTARGKTYTVAGLNMRCPKNPVVLTSEKGEAKCPVGFLTLHMGAAPVTAPNQFRAGMTVGFEASVWKPGKGFVQEQVLGIVTEVDGSECVVYSASMPGSCFRTVTCDKLTWAPRRDQAAVKKEIGTVYMRLSPENLTWDGERSRTDCNREAARLDWALRALFQEFGRRVDESECY